MKRNYCKICGEYAGKGKVCKKCKKDFPQHSAGKEGHPFNRLQEWIKKHK